jgi:hypothetical protein
MPLAANLFFFGLDNGKIYNVQELIDSHMEHFQNLLWREVVKSMVTPEVEAKVQEPAYTNYWKYITWRIWSDFSPREYCVYKGEDKQEDNRKSERS